MKSKFCLYFLVALTIAALVLIPSLFPEGDIMPFGLNLGIIGAILMSLYGLYKVFNNYLFKSHRATIYILNIDGPYKITSYLYRKLRNDGYNVKVAIHDIKPGMNWSSNMAKSIKESDVIIVYLGKHEYSEPYTTRAILLAKKYNKAILPIVEYKCEQPEVLRDIAPLVIFKSEDICKAYPRLWLSLKNLIEISKRKTHKKKNNHSHKYGKD